MSIEEQKAIHHRADIIGRLAADLLLSEERDDRETTSAFRYSYLILRGPQVFLKQFENSDLTLAADEIDRFIRRHGEKVPGQPSLLRIEARTIEDHNNAFRDFLRPSSERKIIGERSSI